VLDRDRFVVGDTAWEKVAPLLPGKPTDPGATGKDNRLFLEAVLWRVRTGAPWRDLPSGFGKWNSVFQRFPPLGEGRRVRARLRLPVRRAGLRIRPGRRHHRHRPPEGERRKGGTQARPSAARAAA
jgi:transposase